MVTPIAKTSPVESVESTIAQSQPIVRAWMEPAANSHAHCAMDIPKNNLPKNSFPINPPLSESPPKSLGDLANLLSLTPTGALDWLEDPPEGEIGSAIPSQDRREEEALEEVRANAASNTIVETTIEAIAPIPHFPSPDRAVSAISSAPEAPDRAVSFPDPEASLDLEEVLEAVQRRVNQEYRRFYGG